MRPLATTEIPASVSAARSFGSCRRHTRRVRSAPSPSRTRSQPKCESSINGRASFSPGAACMSLRSSGEASSRANALTRRSTGRSVLPIPSQTLNPEKSRMQGRTRNAFLWLSTQVSAGTYTRAMPRETGFCSSGRNFSRDMRRMHSATPMPAAAEISQPPPAMPSPFTNAACETTATAIPMAAANPATTLPRCRVGRKSR